MPDLPDLPELIWSRPERPARGPAPAHSRARIAAVAMKIADADGLAALSMRRVATELGAGTMSLYRYVPSKDDLIELMLDEVSAELIPPDGVLCGRWREDLHAIAAQARQAYQRHPWVVTVGRGLTFGPNTLRLAEVTLGTVDNLGLSIDQMVSVTNMVLSFVRGQVEGELAVAARERRTGFTEEQWMVAQYPYLREIIATGKFPLVERVIVDARRPHMSPDEAFEYGLSRILEGIAATLPQEPQSSDS